MNLNHLIIEHLSHYDVEITVAKLIETAEKKGWQNPYTHNLQQSLAKSGKTIRAVKVIEICKPEYSGKMLEKNHERIVSVLMPFRISVYEKEDGKTYLALLNMAGMIAELPSLAAEAIKKASEESFDIIKSVI